MQCDNCGKRTQSSTKCDHCGYVLDRKTHRKKQKASHQIHSSQENVSVLESAPRRVPLFFFIGSLSLIKAAIAIAIIEAIKLILQFHPELLKQEYFQLEPETMQHAIWAGYALLLVYIIAVAWIKISLLRNGSVAVPQVLERIPWRKGYRTAPISATNGGQSTGYVYKGFESDLVPIGSAKFRHIMKLEGNNGKSHTFRWRGYKFVGEYYLYLPNNPRVHMRQSKFRMTLIPKDKKWHVWRRDKIEFPVRLGVVLAIAAIALGLLFIQLQGQAFTSSSLNY